MNSSERLNYKVEVNDFDRVIIPPTSKSYTNRALICAAYSQQTVSVNNISRSTDVMILLKCLKSIGLEIEEDGNNLVFQNSFPECEVKSSTEVVLETGDGGTTNRFLLALLALGKNKYKLIPSKEMLTRPMADLFNALKEVPVRAEIANDSFLIQGPPHKKIGHIEIDCRHSSQFASAMMMAFPTVHLTFKNLKTSKKYLDMTNFVTREVAQKRNFDVPYDWSSLSYPIALGVTMGKVILKGVKYIDELQADSAMMKVLRSSNGKISMTPEGICIEKSDLSVFEIDCSDCPDLVPTLAFLASTIDNESVLKNIKVLKHKESDRLEELLKIFSLFNVKYSYDEENDILKIRKGDGVKEPVFYDAPKDHRMIMTAYLFMRYNQGGEVSNYQHVDKSYPNFFQAMD